MECKVWSVSVECKVWSVKRGLRIVKRKVRSVDCAV